MTKICLVTAVDLEFKIAAGLLKEKEFAREKRLKLCRGIIGYNQVTILQTQMGAVGFASLLRENLLANRYDALLIAGLAGALVPSLKAGDAVVYDRCSDARIDSLSSGSREKPSPREEKASIVCDPRISRFVSDTLRRSGFSCVLGAGVTVAQIATEMKHKIELGELSESIAVDMETYDVLAVCRELELPATAMRVVSDEATIDIPDFNRARRSDGEMDGLRLAQVMLARPVDSWRFLLSLRRAAKALSRNLAAILNAKWCNQ